MLVLAFAIGGCFSDEPPADDLGDPTETGDESGDDGGQTCGGACTDPAPDGWIGPVVLAEFPADESAPSSCAPGYETVVDTLMGGDPEGAAPTCACECELPPDGTCVKLSVDFVDSSTGCTGPSAGSVLAPTGECTPIGPLDAQGDVAVILLPDPTAYEHDDPCVPVDVGTPAPAPSPAFQVLACSPPPALEGCSDAEICLPSTTAGLEDTACVLREGDHECPGGRYFQKRVTYRGLDDGRSCSPCECEDPEVECSYDVQVFATECEGSPALEFDGATSGCGFTLEPPTHVFGQGTPQGTCAAKASEVEGSIERVDIVTACCTN